MKNKKQSEKVWWVPIKMPDDVEFTDYHKQPEQDCETFDKEEVDYIMDK